MADVPDASVVDLAAGTGKFTELLASRPEGYKVTAVEPHADMRGVLEAKQLKGVEVVDGLSAAMPSIKDETVDAVVAAQVGVLSLSLALAPIILSLLLVCSVSNHTL